jgi:predicted O-methyltransferase YrrM
MRALWRRCRPFLQNLHFDAQAGGRTRYYTNDRRYPSGDAFVLAAMMSDRRPRRIVEIGSGFSTAAMLDTLDALGDGTCRLTCIDPHPERCARCFVPPT